MNYILFSSQNDNWNIAIQNTFDNFLKEVHDDKQRIDFIFGEIVGELLQDGNTDQGSGDRFSKISELLNVGGITAAILEISQDLLYQQQDEFREKLFRIFSETYYRFEIRGFNLQIGEIDSATYRYFILIYNKDLSHFVLNTDEGLSFKKGIEDRGQQITSEQEASAYVIILQILLKKIKENILGLENDK